MDYYQLVATASLVIQIVVLILLFGGIWLKRMKKFRQHGITMLTAVVLHTVMILAWMIPSFSNLFSYPISINLAEMITVTILAHAFTGIAAAILGIWLVASWRLRADIKTCFAKKNAMRVTITLWLIALVLGIILYLKIIQLF
jgi:uncharacterized membrane protein YozB (DUF420 family)